MPTTQTAQTDVPQADAWPTLHEAGAHFTLATPKKRPTEPGITGWQSRIPTLAEVVNHRRQGKPLGIVPASLGLVALDVDKGADGMPAAAVARALADAVHADPFCLVPSRGAGRWHAYFKVSGAASIGNLYWRTERLSGEVRGNTDGHIMLWDHGEALAEAVAAGDMLAVGNADLTRVLCDKPDGDTGEVGNRNNKFNDDAFQVALVAGRQAIAAMRAKTKTGLPERELDSTGASAAKGAAREAATRRPAVDWPAHDKPSGRVSRFFEQYAVATADAAPTAWLRYLDGGAWSQRSNADIDRMVGVNMTSPGAREAVHLVRGRAHVERYEDAQTAWHLPYDWKRRAPIAGRVAAFKSGFVRESDPETLIPYADRYSAPRRGGFDPDFGGAAPQYVKFMADLWGDDPHGYCATWADLVFRSMFADCRDHVTAYLVGQAGSGKSTLMDLLAGALGPSLAKRKAGTLAARFGSASLAGKRAVWINEPEAREWHDIQDVLNALADGGLQAVEAKFEAAREVKINAHVFVTANDLPTSWRGNAGQRRRRRVLRFENVPDKPDLNLGVKLEDELPAIVAAWLGHKAAADGGVRYPSDHATVTAEADLQADPVRIWFAERAYIQAGANTKAGDLYGDFKLWYAQQAGGDAKPMGGIPFGRVLSRLPRVADAVSGRFRRRPNVALRPTSE